MAKTKPKVTFEEALARLEKHVAELETGELGLDKSMAVYEEGVRALRECQAILAQAEKRIEVLARLDEDGRPVTETFTGAETDEPATDEEDAPQEDQST
jgi:exodeoxyribonuclease VII small subunit